MLALILPLIRNPYVILAVLAFTTMVYFSGYYAGKNAANTKQEQIDAKVQKRINAVPTADSATTIKRLRGGGF